VKRGRLVEIRFLLGDAVRKKGRESEKQRRTFPGANLSEMK